MDGGVVAVHEDEADEVAEDERHAHDKAHGALGAVHMQRVAEQEHVDETEGRSKAAPCDVIRREAAAVYRGSKADGVQAPCRGGGEPEHRRWWSRLEPGPQLVAATQPARRTETRPPSEADGCRRQRAKRARKRHRPHLRAGQRPALSQRSLLELLAP